MEMDIFYFLKGLFSRFIENKKRLNINTQKSVFFFLKFEKYQPQTKKKRSFIYIKTKKIDCEKKNYFLFRMIKIKLYLFKNWFVYLLHAI